MAKDKDIDLGRHISLLKTRLMSRSPFLGFLLLHLKLFETDRVPIAGVQRDGTLFINPSPFLAESEEEQAWTLAHEVLHPALLFWSRLKGREIQRANIAHDFVINLLLEEWCASSRLAIKRPSDVLFDKQYDGMSFEEVYEKIQVIKVPFPSTSLSGDCLPGTNGQNGSGGDGGDDDNDKKGRGHSITKEEELEWKGLLARARTMQQAMSEDGWGSLPAGLRRMVQDLLDPKLDWWELLSRWIGENGKRENRTFQRPSRRSESVGTYLASITKFGFADVAVLLDTSGSISKDDLRDALSEIKGICEDLELRTRVIVCDARVHADVTIENVYELVKDMRGGGGSDYCPAFDILKKDGFRGICVAITDGYIAVPDERPEDLRGMLWVLHKNGAAPCKWGDVIRIDKHMITEES